MQLLNCLGFFCWFFFFFFFFLFFLEKNTLPSGLVHIAWLGPDPATDLLSSCEGQQSGKRQENSYDPAIYFDHAKDLDGQAGMYCYCEMKEIKYLDHLWCCLIWLTGTWNSSTCSSFLSCLSPAGFPQCRKTRFQLPTLKLGGDNIQFCLWCWDAFSGT